MLKSESTRSRFMSVPSVTGMDRRVSSTRRASVTLKRVTVGDRRFSIATLSGVDSVFARMEQAMMQFSPTGRRRFRSSSFGKKSQKHLDAFRSLVRSVVLLRRCFRMRKKFAVQCSNMTLTHTERSDDFDTYKTSSVSRELRLIMSTPPELRRPDEVRKVQFYLRASGASRLLAGASTPEELEKLARHVAYERYENDRVVAQQGRSPDRFYCMITGKLLIVKEYHIDTGIISKTIGMLTKGMTTSVEEMEQGSFRKESLICRGPVETLVLDRDDYFLIHGEKGGAPREYLSRHALFRSFPFHSAGGHRQMIRLQYFPKGAVIFGGGNEFEWIYVVKSGECSLVRVQMVADFRRQRWPMFNKRTIQELGCERTRRAQSAAERLADFRMWRGPPRTPLSSRRRNCFTAPSNSPSYANRKRIVPSEVSTRVTPRNGSSARRIGMRQDQGISPSLPTVKVSQEHTNNCPIGPETHKDASDSVGQPAPESDRAYTSDYEDEKSNAVDTGSRLPTIPNAGHTVRQHIGSRLSTPGQHLSIPVLRKSRSSMKSAAEISTPAEPDGRKVSTVRSAPPSLRKAYLELGKLKSGDVLGLEDTVAQMEDLPHMRLISDTGAEVVLVNRKFFLRNAPTSLLSRISCETKGYPSIATARTALETQEAWDVYKSALMRIITTKDTLLNTEVDQQKPKTAPVASVKNSTRFGEFADFPPQLLPPGTANKSRNDRGGVDRKKNGRWPMLYKDVPSRMTKSQSSQRITRYNLTTGLRHIKGVHVTMLPNRQTV